MKVFGASVVLCLAICLIKRSSSVTNPKTPPEYWLSYSFHALEEDSNYWVVYHELLNKPPADYIEEIKFIAATTDPAAGEGIATCGGGSSGSGANDPSVNFIVHKTTGAIIPSTGYSSLSELGPFAAGPCGIDTTSAPDSLKYTLQTFTGTADTSMPGIYSIAYNVELKQDFLENQYNPRQGYYPNTPPTDPIYLTAPIVTLTLEVINNAGASITTIDIGSTFNLKLTVTVAPYKADVDIAGAIVHTCKVATDISMTTNLETFIDESACSVTTGLFSTSATDTGFSVGSSSLSGTTHTYIANSHDLEAAAVFPGDLTTASHDLYFRCSVTFCYNAGTGQCGGNHCTRRKKREAMRTDTHVMTKLQVRCSDKLEVPEKPLPCAESLMFRATLGTLGTTAILLFFGVIFSFMSLRRAQSKVQKHNGLDGSKTSSTQLKTDSMSSISSYPQSRKC